MDEECGRFELGCKAVKGATGAVGDAVTGQIEELVNGILERVVDTLVYFMTFWLRTPSASLDAEDPVGGAIVQVQEYTSVIMAFFAVLGLLIAAGRMAWMVRVDPVKDIGMMFLRVMFVQAIAVTGTQLLLRAGDEFSPWLVETALGETMDYSVLTLMPFIAAAQGAYALNGPFVVTQGIGAMLIMAIILLVVTALQVLFLLLRDVLLAIILAFLPTLAAATLFKSGDEGFQKALGWIVGLLVYKPVAAVIYVLGTLMVKGVAGDQEDPAQQWMALLLGTMTLVLAVVALPALMKFVAPAAGRGVSSAFSGGAALGAATGAAATGAAVVAIAGTGGAAAPAAAGAGTGGAAAGASSAAPAATTGSASGVAAAAPQETAQGASGTPSASGPGSGSGIDSSGVSEATSGTEAGSGAPGTGTPGGGAEAEGAQSTGSEPSTPPSGSEAAAPNGAPAQGASNSGGDSGSAGTRAQAMQSISSEMGEGEEKSGAAVEDMTK
ncbi:hypothetical protein V1260_15395 [Brachybacterium sp. J144]|uniref:hypothetical protein n=1 Tax=Brachybacterium sp. J144 TaxID=3116487 RepID=UPI002E77B527|nr:hypothetical protein [Brachybacterium sp. J144]MEE1652166.1 hypothetical protein [Brachybacterium sp. J144]